ncbi:MAG: cell division protein, partial [Bacteroidota bacterium]|nr:cell division protein [Bacteroidota bacterium]
MNVKRDILWRVWVSFGLVCALAVAVVIQIIKLQTVNRGYYANLADSLTTAYFSIEPLRGNIYAADGSVLVTSIPIYEVRMDMKVDGLTKNVFNSNVDSLAYCLAMYFKDKSPNKYREELSNAYRKGARYHLIRRNLTHTQLKDIKQFPLFRQGRFKGGMIVEQTSKRILPFGALAQRTIGYARKDIKPVGLEGAYDSSLRGAIGKRLMQKVSGGVWLPINDENELEPQDGLDIITTLDVNFQDITQNALHRTVSANEADHGCAIVMDVSTGHIKAIANLTRSKDGKYREEYNYAVGESTEPGSTFK